MRIPNQTIWYQRGESLAIFLAATYVYFDNQLSWVAYLLLLFSFDIFMVGYLFNSKIGACLYNIGHSLISPSLLVITYVILHDAWILGLACLWFAHIGFDRAFGYGLKMNNGFKHTHLGEIGK